MADLPTYQPAVRPDTGAGLPTYQSQDLVKEIGVVRPDAGAGLDQLAAGTRQVAQQFGDMAERTATANAADAGEAQAAALQRDTNGNLEPLPWRDNSSPENIAYNHALKVGAESGFEIDQRNAADRLRATTPYDPDAFGKLWAAQTDGATSALDPRFAPIAQQKMAQIGTEVQNGIINQTRQRDFHLANQDWSATLAQKENDLASLASAGQTEHPAYQQTMNDYIDTLNQGVASHFIGQGQADVRRVQTADDGEALAISKHALDAYQAAGRGANGEAAAQGILQQIDDPKFQISPERRQQIESTIQRRIGEDESIRRQQVDDLWQQAEPAVAKLRLGINVDPGAIEQMRQGLLNAGAPKLAAQIETEATLQQQVRALGQLPLDQQQAKLDQFQKSMDDGSASEVEGRLANALPQMMNEKAKALTADPFGYGATAHPNMVGPVAPIDWSQPPQALAPVLQQRLAQAQKISAYEGVFTPPISTQESRTLAATITADPENAPARLNAIQTAAGPAWPSLWRGLTTAGKLPPEYQAVGALDDPGQAALLARGLAERGKSGKSLDDLLVPREKTGIDSAIETDPDVRSLLSSLSRSGATAGMQDSVLSSVKSLAYANSAYSGLDQSSAVSRAVAAFTGNYEYMPGGARVPRDRMDAVSANAAATLNALSPDTIATPALYGQPGMPKPEEYAAAIKSAPSWITSPQSNALWLMDTQGRLVRDKSGKPVAVPFDAAPPSDSGGTPLPLSSFY